MERQVLFHSSSWIALAAAIAATGSVTGAALAADLPVIAADPMVEVVAPRTPYFFSIEGGPIFAHASVDKVGDGPEELDLDDELGGFGAVAIGREFNQNWDWRLGLSLSMFRENDEAFSDFEPEGDASFSASLGSDIDFATADFDIGYKLIASNAFDLRFFAGARALWSEESADKMGAFSDPPLSVGLGFGYESDFIGIGPRAGMEFASRFGETGRFGLSGMIAGAAIFGSRDTDYYADFSVCDGGCTDKVGEESDTDSDTVYNLEGSIGADIHAGEGGKFTVGYRAQQWWGLRENSDEFFGEGGGPFGALDVDEDLLIHGPFVKYSGRF